MSKPNFIIIDDLVSDERIDRALLDDLTEWFKETRPNLPANAYRSTSYHKEDWVAQILRGTEVHQIIEDEIQ